jgi:hypothetical protein
MFWPGCKYEKFVDCVFFVGFLLISCKKLLGARIINLFH